ncbi:unnamed protein product [Discosporangium mesarthrocarpum]
MDEGVPVVYLAIANPSVRNNLGTLIRCAAAFAVKEVVVVGVSKFSTHGAHGSQKHVQCVHFHDWATAAAYLRGDRRCHICGIGPPPLPETPDADGDMERKSCEAELGSAGVGLEGIRDSIGTHTLLSMAVHLRPFRGSTAFLVGHNNTLEQDALGLCDYLVHVQQVLDVPVALGAPVTTSIALHHFTSWARYKERRHSGEKFLVEPQAVISRRPPTTQDKSRKYGTSLTAQRAKQREEHEAADPLGEGAGPGDDGGCPETCSKAGVLGGLLWCSGSGDGCEGGSWTEDY